MSQPEDMFVCDMEEKDISCPPAWKKLKKSQCTPLFMNAYTMRGESMTGHCLFGDSFIYCSKWNRIGVRQKERDFYLSGRLSDWVEISFSSFPSLDVLPKKKKKITYLAKSEWHNSATKEWFVTLFTATFCKWLEEASNLKVVILLYKVIYFVKLFFTKQRWSFYNLVFCLECCFYTDCLLIFHPYRINRTGLIW